MNCFQPEFEILNEGQHPPASVEYRVSANANWRKTRQVYKEFTSKVECQINQIYFTNWLHFQQNSFILSEPQNYFFEPFQNDSLIAADFWKFLW